MSLSQSLCTFWTLLKSVAWQKVTLNWLVGGLLQYQRSWCPRWNRWHLCPQRLYFYSKVSKSCNHAITPLSKIFINLQIFLNNKQEKRKTTTYFMHLSHFDKVFLVAHAYWFYLIVDWKKKTSWAHLILAYLAIYMFDLETKSLKGRVQ